MYAPTLWYRIVKAYLDVATINTYQPLWKGRIKNNFGIALIMSCFLFPVLRLRDAVRSQDQYVKLAIENVWDISRAGYSIEGITDPRCRSHPLPRIGTCTTRVSFYK